ncbi:MAG: endolytic transglycosylase MltG [Patescibacteria group bacterium]
MVTIGTIIRWALLGALLLFSFITAFYQFVLTAPVDFVPGSFLIIEPGQTISGMAQTLTIGHVVRSPMIFRSLVILYGGERTAPAGMYVFNTPQNVFQVARRISRGDYGYAAVKLTIPEGLNSMEISKLISEKFSYINEGEAEVVLKQYEGMLFPETYFFPPRASLQMIVDRLRAQFDKSIEPLSQAIVESDRNLQEIITMASILEEEVQNDIDRRLVADLLWRRLEMGMALQVDSTIGYVLGKGSLELTTKDLQINSPYNSYRYKGLPPTPISNPGLAAIEAALMPTPNKYLFFLSDKDGINHFAVTYSEHVKNRKKYLGK